VAVAGLLPEKAENLGWDSLRPLLSDPRDFLGRLAGLAAPGKDHVLATLGPIFAGADFRPENLMSVSRAAAHLCRWCLALFVHSGGAPPAQAPRARPERQPLEERKITKVARAPESPAAGALDHSPPGELRVVGLSGEVMATLGAVRPQWTRCEILRALKKSRPLPDGKVYRLVCGTTPVRGPATLADLGLDPTLPEGAEITAILCAVPEEVRPQLDAASECLRSLRKADLHELKALKNPPRLALMSCKAVYAAMHPDVPSEHVTWKDCRQMLQNPSFLPALLDFDKDADPDGVQRALAPFVQDETFTVENARRASIAGAGFCLWCHGIYAYSAVLAGV